MSGIQSGTLNGLAVDAARADILRAGASLFARGYVHASAGNISTRLEDGFLITPTDAPLGFLQADRLAHVAADGTQLSGDRASKTLALHRRIYAADPSARVVIHTHATHLVALTLLDVWHEDDILPPLTPYQVMKVGHVPLIAYHRPGHPDVAELVEAAIRTRAESGTRLRAVMLERLGPVVWGPDIASAMATLEELEETARLWLVTGRTPTPLSESALEDLAAAFSTPW